MKNTRPTFDVKAFFSDAKKRKLFITITSILMAAIIVATVVLCCTLIPLYNREVSVNFYDHEGKKQSITLKYGEELDMPTPTREYYTFEGWYFDQELTKAYKDGFFENFNYKEDIDLFPKWRITDPVIIEFESMGGSYVADVAVPRGAPVDKSWFSEKEGNSLLGWCYDANLTQIFMPGDRFNEDTTLYAKWMLNEITDEDTITVMFDTKGGSSVDSITIKMGTVALLPDTNRVGYDFLGWYTDEEYKYKYNSSVVLVQSIILYAKWEKNEVNYSLKFDTRGGETINTKLYLNGTFVEVDALPTPTKQDDTFLYWCTDKDCKYALTGNFYIKSDVTLYAKYSSDDAEIIENVNIYYHLYDSVVEGRYILRNTRIENWIPYRKDYTFDGWYADSEYTEKFDFSILAYEGATLYAKWKKNDDYSDEYFLYVLSRDNSYLIVNEEKDRSLTNLVIPSECNGKPVKEIKDGLFKGRIIESIIIGDNVEIIGQEAFSESLISEIILPSSVKTIKDKAFYKASNLTSVTIDGQAEIGEMAFANCGKLTTVVASKVKSVGEEAFYECISLRTVNLRSLDTAGWSVFENCIRLESIDLSNSTLTEMAPSLFKGTIQLNNISLPSTLVEIKSGAFLGSGITRINTSKVTIIGSSAFSECNRLTIVEIGKELVQVSTDSFYNCPLLQSYVVSQDNEKFCSYQGNMYNKDMTTLKFYANGNSSTLTLPASVTSIDIPTLIHAKNLARIEVDSANTVYSSIDGNLYSKDGTELCYYAVNKEEREFTVPSTVTTIRSYCFMSSDKLERVIINSNVTNIQIGCFYNMTALTEIVNNSGVMIIKDQHYVDCNLLSVIQ